MVFKVMAPSSESVASGSSVSDAACRRSLPVVMSCRNRRAAWLSVLRTPSDRGGVDPNCSPQTIGSRHMLKADLRELKARADGPEDSLRTQDSFP